MNAYTRPALALLALAFAGVAAAVPAPPLDPPTGRPIVQLERGFETDSGAVLLPPGDSGTITVNQCAGCKSQRLVVDAHTQFFAGAQSVTLATLKSLLSPGRTTPMTVYSDPKAQNALRVVAHVAAPPAARR